jgi:hypothetical protein
MYKRLREKWGVFMLRVFEGDPRSQERDLGQHSVQGSGEDILMVGGIRSEMVLIIASLILPLSFLARAQEPGTHYEIGIVYYADGGSYKALDKEIASQGGRSNYSAKVKGAHATLRLQVDQTKVFRVCGVDPSRFKLYRFKSEGNARTVTIAKVNMWIGGSKGVLSESEIPVAIQASESGCFTLSPKEAMGDGEFGFSPLESSDSFMFGVGDIRRSK